VRTATALGVGVAAIALVSSTAGCGGDATGDGAVTVFAASSMTDALDRLDERGALGNDLTVVLAGSTSLVTQLAEGAEADLLITADEATMARAVGDGSVAGPPQVFATNHLVLAVPAGNPGAVDDLDDLGDPDLDVGTCAPQVPCGALAATATEALGVEPDVDTEEPSVRSLTAKLRVGQLDAGLIYLTDAQHPDLEIVPVDGLDAFVTSYVAATVAASDAADADALRVVDALTDDPETQGMLAELGFGLPSEATP